MAYIIYMTHECKFVTHMRLTHRPEALPGNRRSDVRRFTYTHGQQIIYDELDVSVITEREKAR